MKSLKKRLGVLTVIASIALTALSTSAAPARGVYRASDCRTETAAVPIPRETAQEQLPPGFQAGMGAASQGEFPYVYFESVVCGKDHDAPTLTKAIAYLWSTPPSKYQTSGSGARFILSAAIGGRDAPRFERALCAQDVFSGGDISQVEHFKTPDGAAIETTVVSDGLSATWDTATATIQTDVTRATRSFYKTDHGIGFFDAAELIDIHALGTATIRFDKPFLDLPQASGGPAMTMDTELVFPTQKCSK
jgi:hypothetical protein